MVLMDGTDSTDSTSVTPWTKDSTATSVIYTNYYDKLEYEPNYIAEEIEAVRFGWYNPRKIPIPSRPIITKIMFKIRNQLPYKQRADG
jgi:hypothetical protein